MGLVLKSEAVLYRSHVSAITEQDADNYKNLIARLD